LQLTGVTDTCMDTSTDMRGGGVRTHLEDGQTVAHARCIGRVRDKPDAGSDCPRVVDGLEARSFSSPRRGQYVMLKNPHTRAYVSLRRDEYFLFPLMDGSRQITDLVLAYFVEYRVLAFERISHVVAELRRLGFLTDPPVDSQSGAAEQRGRFERWKHGLHAATSPALMLEDADVVFDWLYRRGAWLLFTRPALGLLGLLAMLGVVLPVWIFGVLGQDPIPHTSSSFGMFGLLAAFACVILVHEAGHGLAAKAFGREVRCAGVQLYFGFPTFVVDTTDMWMAPRAARIAVASAGVIAGLVVSGVAMLFALAFPSSPLAPFADQCAFAGVFTNLLNLVPLLELDGYYLLVDLLDMPLLRPRALTFVRRELWRKFAMRQSLRGEDWILTTFGVAATAYSTFTVLRAAQFLLDRVGALRAQIEVNQLWARPTVAAIVLVGIVAAAGPLSRSFTSRKGAVLVTAFDIERPALLLLRPGFQKFVVLCGR
jgi:putative peptide zinc metalloprotease protein